MIWNWLLYLSSPGAPCYKRLDCLALLRSLLFSTESKNHCCHNLLLSANPFFWLLPCFVYKWLKKVTFKSHSDASFYAQYFTVCLHSPLTPTEEDFFPYTDSSPSFLGVHGWPEVLCEHFSLYSNLSDLHMLTNFVAAIFYDMRVAK